MSQSLRLQIILIHSKYHHQLQYTKILSDTILQFEVFDCLYKQTNNNKKEENKTMKSLK